MSDPSTAPSPSSRVKQIRREVRDKLGVYISAASDIPLSRGIVQKQVEDFLVDALSSLESQLAEAQARAERAEAERETWLERWGSAKQQAEAERLRRERAEQALKELPHQIMNIRCEPPTLGDYDPNSRYRFGHRDARHAAAELVAAASSPSDTQEAT